MIYNQVYIEKTRCPEPPPRVLIYPNPHHLATTAQQGEGTRAFDFEEAKGSPHIRSPKLRRRLFVRVNIQ